MMEGEEKLRKKSSLENLKNSENHVILYIESERETSSLTDKKTDWVTTYREKRRTL